MKGINAQIKTIRSSPALVPDLTDLPLIDRNSLSMKTVEIIVKVLVTVIAMIFSTALALAWIWLLLKFI